MECKIEYNVYELGTNTWFGFDTLIEQTHDYEVALKRLHKEREKAKEFGLDIKYFMTREEILDV